MSEMLLSLKVTADGKIAVTQLQDVGDAGGKAGQKLKDGLKKPKQEAKDLAAVIDDLKKKVMELGSIAAITAFVEHMIKVSDTQTLLRARMAGVTSGVGEQKAAMGQLFDIAQRLELPFRDLAAQFPRIASAIQYYGGSTRDAIDVTKVLVTTAKLAGRTEEEATMQVAAFAQSLEDGAIQGREVKAMLGQNVELARALAAGFGVTTAELKRMGDEGLLTSQNVVQALVKQQAAVEEKGKQIPHTVEGSWGALVAELKKGSEAITLVNAGLALSVELLEKIRELKEKERKSGPGLVGSAMLWAAGIGDSIAGRTAPAAAPKPQISSAPNRDQAIAAAEGELRNLVAQSDTVAGINARFENEIARINNAAAQLAKTEHVSAEQTAQYQALIKDAYLKRQLALEALAQKGVASQQAEIDAMKRRADLEAVYAQNYYDLQQDSVKRSLDLEDYYHQAALTDEREFINRRADLQREAAQYAVDQAQGSLERELALLTQLKAQVAKAPTPTQRVQVQAQVSEQEGKVDKARAQLTITTRNLSRVEEDRGHNTTLLNQKLEQEVRQITRDYEDYRRAIDNSVKQLQLEVDLVGKDEIAQSKARKELELRTQVEEKRIQLRRQLKDLQDFQHADDDDPRVKALKKQLEDLGVTLDEDIAKFNKLFERQYNANFANDLAKGITDAIVNGGKDAAPMLRKTLEDQFKKPFQVAFQSFMKDAVQGFMKQIGFDPAAIAQNPMMGLTFFAGSALGGLGANALGAGSRGQQIASSLGGFIGALPAAIIGYFSDPHGLADRHAQFGTNPSGQYSYSSRSAFGTFGTFNDRWFSDSDMGQQLRQFLTQLSGLENTFASMMTPQQLATARASLSGARDYSFGTEHGDFTATLTQILKDRLSKVVDALLPGLGHLVQESQEGGDGLVKLAQALLELNDASQSIQATIVQISGTAAEQIKYQIDALIDKVSKAQGALNAAFDSNDPVRIAEAEKNLQAAVLDRYQTEIQMVRSLQQLGRQIGEDAYQFAISIAQKINSVGGSVNVGAIAMGRAGELRGNITNGVGSTADRISDLQGYEGAIDAWYQSRRDAIERDTAAQAKAAQAIANAQASAAQARQAQLQSELELAKQFQGLADHATQMLKDLQLSSANPLSAYGRLGLAQQDARDLLTRYRASSGNERINLGTQLLEALQTYRSMGQDAYQRPSPEWQAIYNEIAADLTEVQKDSKSYAERQTELQAQILEVQQQAASYQMMAASAAQGSNAALNALDEEARGYYTWAQQEGARLYAIQRREAHDQLVAITGGMDANLFIADRQRESVAILKSIDARIAAWLASQGASSSTGAGNDVSNGGSPVNGIGRSSVVILITTKLTTSELLKAAEPGAPELGRMLARAGVKL